MPGWGPWSMKVGITYAHAPARALSRVVALRLHFDDSRKDNGPLRVLPGTHTLGLLTQADTERLVREIPAVDCLVPSGGIVAMRPLILHASSKAEADHPRRVVHIEYVDSETLTPENVQKFQNIANRTKKIAFLLGLECISPAAQSASSSSRNGRA